MTFHERVEVHRVGSTESARANHRVITPFIWVCVRHRVTSLRSQRPVCARIRQVDRSMTVVERIRHKTAVKARFWPWLSVKSPETPLNCCLFARKRCLVADVINRLHSSCSHTRNTSYSTHRHPTTRRALQYPGDRFQPLTPKNSSSTVYAV